MPVEAERRRNGDDGTSGTGAPAAPMPRFITRQIADSGTPKQKAPDRGLLILPDEYVRELKQPHQRMQWFEEMRASDEGINSALEARIKMIGASNWALSMADDTPNSQELRDFAEDNLLPHLSKLLANLGGGMLQYGFGLVEPVYKYNDFPFSKHVQRRDTVRASKTKGRYIYLQKTVHIRQKSITSFIINQDTKELESAEQQAYNGLIFQRVEVPIDKLLLLVYGMQGDDYYGVPPMRAVYRAWKFKQQLEKLNLLGVDRFGVGTPVGVGGEGWGDPEFDRMEKYLKAWRSGASTYLLLPFGGTVDIKAQQGGILSAVLDWVKFYEIGIAKTFLTQATQLGSTETGARALGEVFLEQAEVIVQDDNEALATLLNERLIVPMIDWNFGPQDEYPVFTPSQRVRQSSAVYEVIGRLAAQGVVKIEPQDEQWFRDGLGMPPIDIEAREAEQEALAEQMAQAMGETPAGAEGEDAPGAVPPPGAANNLPPNGPPSRKPGGFPKKPLTRLQLIARAQARDASVRGLQRPYLPQADPAHPPMFPGAFRTLAFTEWEARIVRPHILSRDLDLEALRLTGEVQEALRQIDAELERQVVALAGNGRAALTDGIAGIVVPQELRARLRDVMAAAAERARGYGAESVRQELARQHEPENVGPERTTPYAGVTPPRVDGAGDLYFHAPLQKRLRELQIRRPGGYPTDEDQARDAEVSAEIDRAVEDEIDRREQSARRAAVTAITQTAAAAAAAIIAVVTALVRRFLSDLSPNRTADNVNGVVNVSFGTGRRDAADVITETGEDNLIGKVYSSVLDGSTCAECARWDGAEFPIAYPEDFRGLQAPNPRCAGTYARCRCIFIYVTAEEVPALTPGTRGPGFFTRWRQQLKAATPEREPMTVNIHTPPVHVTVHGQPAGKRITTATKDPKTGALKVESHTEDAS